MEKLGILNKKPGTSLRTFKRLFSYITKYWELKVILVLIIFTTTSTTMAPAIVGSIIDLIKAVTEGEPVVAGGGVAGIVFNLFAPIGEWVSNWQGMTSNVMTCTTVFLSRASVSTTNRGQVS